MFIKVLKVGLPGAILAAGLLVTSVHTKATPAYAKKEQMKCVGCHVTAGKKDLNDTGKCYKEHDHSMAACKAPAAKK